LELLKGYEALHQGADADDLWLWITSDLIFGLPTATFVDARVHNGAPTWSYHFAWHSPVHDGYYGSAHTMDIPFVFGTFGAKGVVDLLGTTTGEMDALSRVMQEAWVAFASTGSPAVDQLRDWRANEADTRPTMVFDERCHVVEDPFSPVVELWQWAQNSER
jgi:para-nitrobenzyl esterase